MGYMKRLNKNSCEEILWSHLTSNNMLAVADIWTLVCSMTFVNKAQTEQNFNDFLGENKIYM